MKYNVTVHFTYETNEDDPEVAISELREIVSWISQVGSDKAWDRHNGDKFEYNGEDVEVSE